MLKRAFKKYTDKFLNKLNELGWVDYCTGQVEIYGMQYKEFSIFAIANFTFPNFMWSKGLSDGFIVVSLKYIAGILCAGLLMKENWPKKLQLYFPLYWYLTLLFCLPFTMTIMVLDHDFANGWIVLTLLSIFLLASLVSWKDYLAMMSFGIMTAVLFFHMIGGNPSVAELNQETKFWCAYAFIFASLIGLIFTRNKELLEKERDESAKSIAGMIAHEVRNPLFALGGGIYGLKRAASHKDLNKTNEIIGFLDKTLHETNFTIQMILTKLRGVDADYHTYSNFSIKECIEEALKEYNFSDGEREKVFYSCHKDFFFRGNKILMKHIIFNLLKNSLGFISGRALANITIETLALGLENVLIFKDTGPGIKLERIDNLFKSFKSSRDNGTGLGLHFCHKVMKSFNGNISCTSVENEYTAFILSFKPLD
jgi:signal transduction histidine kinase